jgi:hypothetical protein
MAIMSGKIFVMPGSSVLILVIAGVGSGKVG